MIRYISMSFTRSSLITRVIQDQLPDVRALRPLVQLEAGILECLVDTQPEPHRLLNLIPNPILISILQSVIAVELIDHLDAIGVNPDRQRVPSRVTHTRLATTRIGKDTDPEVTP